MLVKTVTDAPQAGKLVVPLNLEMPEEAFRLVVAQSLKNPFAKGNMTKLKLFLPISKKEAWNLIATPKGLASWFPTKCKGKIQPGRTLEFEWPDGTVENHRVISVGEANSSIILDWWETGKAALYLHGREPTHLTL